MNVHGICKPFDLYDEKKALITLRPEQQQQQRHLKQLWLLQMKVWSTGGALNLEIKTHFSILPIKKATCGIELS